MELRFIEPRGALYAQELDLRFRVLREPLGFRREDVRFPFEDESLHLVAIEGGQVVGCVLFHPEGERSGRLFQMAVEPAQQRRRIGDRLVRGLEEELARRGFRELTLHARASAIGFYEKLGYACFGEPYEEVGVPHRSMRRALP